MKNAKVSIISLIFILTAFTTACHKSTKVEKDVVIGPGGTVSDTKVDREVTTGIEDKDIKVETKVDLE